MINSAEKNCSCKIEQVPYKMLLKLAIDHKRWAKLYKCKECGQYWDIIDDESTGKFRLIPKKIIKPEVLNLYGDPDTKTPAHDRIEWK